MPSSALNGAAPPAGSQLVHSSSVGIYLERHSRAFLVMGVATFAAALLGLASRHAFSVSFWPANAIVVGLMLRQRRLSRMTGWLGTWAGYVAADVLFGNMLPLSALFACTNLAATFTAFALLARLDRRDLSLRRDHAMLRILACLLPACLAGGAAGALLVVVEFGGSFTQTLMTWPASELVNYLVVLPAMLTVSPRRYARKIGRLRGLHYRKMAPILLLVMTSAASVWFDGPGSIMFPMPALLLCALTYSIPTTAVLTMALGTGCLLTIGLGIIDIGQDLSEPGIVVSIRIAVAFLVLVPLTVSSIMIVQKELMTQLREAADHDGLTGLLNRRAFEHRMRERLATARFSDKGLAILWLDIDFFKSVNDRHGHLAGDLLLQGFAKIARSCCRHDDLVGRMGGEEFALLVEVRDLDAAYAIADRLREKFAAHTIFWNAAPVRATVSIAACHLDCAPDDVRDLIMQLDEALYSAKGKGRDRVEWLPSALSV